MIPQSLVEVLSFHRPAAELALLAALLGACVGSFLNVVVWRVPREESVLWPASHCPRCGTTLAWFENIPLLGWCLLRARCRYCKAPISGRYPAVEALCSGLWVMVLLAQPDAMGSAPAQPWLWIAGWILVSLLLLLALIDLDQLWIPEPICRWGVVVGWLVTAALAWPQPLAVGRQLMISHLLAAAFGLMGFDLLSVLAARWMGRPAIGSGDAKVGALLGAWLGPLGLAVAVLVSVLLAALVGGVALAAGVVKRHQPIPFVPFLAVGGVLIWLTGAAPWWAWLTGTGSA